MRAHALRLHPHDDLADGLTAFAADRGVLAGAIVTCVGSLLVASLRLADQPSATRFDGPFEVVSLVGTLSPHGSHLHLSIADDTGVTIGGHVMPGNIIYTTAEIVIADLDHLEFLRPLDPDTGCDELDIVPRSDGLSS